MALRTGRSSTVAMLATFLATLFLPIAAAVGIGVALSLLLQLNREALDLTVVELAPEPDGQFAERPAPASLIGRSVTLLDVYGSLYYAGARTLATLLPDPEGASAPVVILRLRGRTALGATAYKVLSRPMRRTSGRGRRTAAAERGGARTPRSTPARRAGRREGPRGNAESRPYRRVEAAAYAAGRTWRDAHPKASDTPGDAEVE